MFTVYILYSKTTQNYYTGQTQDLANRLCEHNSGDTKSIASGIPWELVWSAEKESRADAMQLYRNDIYNRPMELV